MGGYKFGSGMPSWNGMPMVGGARFSTGSTYFVDSAAGSNGYTGKSSSKAFSTLDYAIGKCTANKGDTIYVMPNHAETITGAGGITADIAGITIIGLGSYNQRPRFLMDGGTTVTFLVSAADVTVRNLVHAAGHADVATCYDVTGKGCWIDECEFVENVVDENFVTPIKATGAANTADGLRVTNCRAYGVDASTAEFVEITDDIMDLYVVGNTTISEGTACPIVLQAGTKVMIGSFIAWNFLSHKNTAGALLLSNGGTGNTGILAHNRVGHADVTTTQDWGAATGLRLFDNLSVSTDALSGFVLPAIDVNS